MNDTTNSAYGEPGRVLILYLPGYQDGRELPEDVNWHYRAHPREHLSIGVSASGQDVEFDHVSRKVRRIYSLNQRREVVAAARASSPAEASREHDIPAATIRSWMKRAA